MSVLFTIGKICLWSGILVIIFECESFRGSKNLVRMDFKYSRFSCGLYKTEVNAWNQKLLETCPFLCTSRVNHPVNKMEKKLCQKGSKKHVKIFLTLCKQHQPKAPPPKPLLLTRSVFRITWHLLTCIYLWKHFDLWSRQNVKTKSVMSRLCIWSKQATNPQRSQSRFPFQQLVKFVSIVTFEKSCP